MLFPAFWASKFAPKSMLTIHVFQIKEGKNTQKVKKILAIIYHYLLEEDSNGHMCGGVLPRKLLKFEARKCHFLHSGHPNLLQN
jgi:hypothetical protein